MKYALIAALLSTCWAAELTGCKPGINIKFFKDSDCTKDTNGTLPAYQEDVAETGKCIEHKPPAEVFQLKYAEAMLAYSKKEIIRLRDKLDNFEKLTVDDQGTNKTVPDALGNVYTDLRNKLVTSNAAEHDFNDICNAVTWEDEDKVDEYYAAFGTLYDA